MHSPYHAHSSGHFRDITSLALSLFLSLFVLSVWMRIKSQSLSDAAATWRIIIRIMLRRGRKHFINRCLSVLIFIYVPARGVCARKVCARIQVVSKRNRSNAVSENCVSCVGACVGAFVSFLHRQPPFVLDVSASQSARSGRCAALRTPG